MTASSQCRTCRAKIECLKTICCSLMRLVVSSKFHESQKRFQFYCNVCTFFMTRHEVRSGLVLIAVSAINRKSCAVSLVKLDLSMGEPMETRSFPIWTEVSSQGTVVQRNENKRHQLSCSSSIFFHGTWTFQTWVSEPFLSVEVFRQCHVIF